MRRDPGGGENKEREGGEGEGSVLFSMTFDVHDCVGTGSVFRVPLESRNMDHADNIARGITTTTTRHTLFCICYENTSQTNHSSKFQTESINKGKCTVCE